MTVGNDGDYDNINDAIEYFSRRVNVYESSGVFAKINLLTGFVMSEQVMAKAIDLSWITITSDDTEVSIDASALTSNIGSYLTNYPAFGAARGGKLPRIGALFTMDSSASSKDGVIAVDAGSSVTILPDCGIKKYRWTRFICYILSNSDG